METILLICVVGAVVCGLILLAAYLAPTSADATLDHLPNTVSTTPVCQTGKASAALASFFQNHALAATFAVVVALAGCGHDAPVAPTVPSCQANNTASVHFTNQSTHNYSYTIVWDGFDLFTLSPGQSSTQYTVAGGVAHRLDFKIANTSTLACNTSSPNPEVCSTTHNYTCSN
jgi:hypothetical protein